MPTIKENLIAAKALIDTPEKWLQGRYRAKRGERRCFCAMGALFEVCGTGTNALEEARNSLNAQLPPGWRSRTIGMFNDHTPTTHSDVVAVFDRAIAAQDGAK